MDKEPNWSKQGTIATWVAVGVAVLLYILQQIWPPDPLHPMSLDFLSRSLAVPPWLAFITLVLVAAIPAIYVRRVSNKPLYDQQKQLADQQNQQLISAQKEIERLRGETASQSDRIAEVLRANIRLQEENDKQRQSLIEKGALIFGLNCDIETLKKDINEPKRISLPKPTARTPSLAEALANYGNNIVSKPPFIWDISVKQKLFDWPEDLRLQIDWNVSHSYGYVVYVCNGRDDDISSYQLDVAEASSWSERHQKFLPNRFNRRRVMAGTNLLAMHKTDAQWLIRTSSQQPNPDQMVIGNDGENPLIWPNNDSERVQIWRLTLALAYRTDTTGRDNSLQGLPPAYLLVRWDPDADTSMAMLRDDEVLS